MIREITSYFSLLLILFSLVIIGFNYESPSFSHVLLFGLSLVYSFFVFFADKILSKKTIQEVSKKNRYSNILLVKRLKEQEERINQLEFDRGIKNINTQ